MTTFDGHQVLGGLSKEAEESPCTDEKTEAREAVYSASVWGGAVQAQPGPQLLSSLGRRRTLGLLSHSQAS